MFEPYPWTFPHAEQRLKILEGNLRVPEWSVFEDDEINQGRHHQEVNPALAPYGAE
jgi:hypothetical protein